MDRQRLSLVCVAIAILGCRGKTTQPDGGGLDVKTVTPEQLPSDIRGAVEDTARRQAVAANGAVTTIRRAYPYEGYSWYEPTAEGRLVAV